MTIIPSNIDFATEVKSDRLSLLWKLTLAGSLFVLVVSAIVFSYTNFDSSLWIYTPLTLCLSTLATRYWLKHGQYTLAAWTFTLGALVAVAVGMLAGGIYFDLVPFMFVVVVLIGGLLLKPKSIAVVAGLAIFFTLAVPWLISQTFLFTGYQLFAILLMLLAAGLAAQVTGELYAVTEWALLNYQRERRSNDELFDNRKKLELSLKRSEALGERLMLTNTDLENARTAAETAKKFRGQFLANMSHELRTPLNAIIGFSETMLKFPIMYDDVHLPEAYQADMQQIYNSGTQLLTLINDILDLAKVDAGRLEIHQQAVDLIPIIQSTLATANGLIGSRQIILVNTLPAELPPIFADSNRVRQVLLNLYSNAVKFTDAGEIVLSGGVVGDELHLSLRDSGCGIPQESLDLIFEEFKQANQGERDPRSGAGLGLAISRQLVTMMGGDISAESEIGKGSTFHVTFPLHQPAPTRADSKTEADLPATNSSSALPTPLPTASPTVSSSQAALPMQQDLTEPNKVEPQVSQELL